MSPKIAPNMAVSSFTYDAASENQLRIEPADGVLLQPAHGTAAVQNENKLGKIFLHNNALRFVVYRFRWQKDTTNRRAKGQRAGDKSRTQLFLIVFKQ